MPVTGRVSAIVFDRDGVLNELCYFPGSRLADSPTSPSQVRLVDGAGLAVRRVNNAGVPCFIASNQPGIAKRKMSASLLSKTTRRLLELLESEDAVVDGISYCLHHPDSAVPGLRALCPDRKPAPGMLLRISSRLGVDPKQCWMIGDSGVDILAAQRAGFSSVRVRSFDCETSVSDLDVVPDLVAPDPLAAVTMILGGTNVSISR
ncbi:D-glycero-alpha-D-manno-heptose-1,7-bisphosphate 7-phosphatase [Nocardia aurea]|uniref:D-glycero-alpha-D-manno-heptose-1,7-bisphosphate 7-phosphatase n=1 Tax=Nocardia aurea TaxID=2144174 RepID=UPI000D68CEAF